MSVSSSVSTIQKPVRVRFAPSPTGYLHVGGARTALYNYLYAKKTQGDFILRIEDTDLARSTQESLEMLIEDLQWLGLDWQEGPDSQNIRGPDRGPYAPYRQSQRLEIYQRVAQDLIAKDKAYYCFQAAEPAASATSSESSESSEFAESLDSEGRFSPQQSPYAKWTLAQALEHLKKGHSATIRFRNPGVQDYFLKDLVRGEVRFPSDMVGDFVLIRSNGMPVYNFCCAVDDYEMRITHVLRAEEHLPNTLRQMMIYEAMGWELPQFGHLSLILDESRKKLSKRKGATSCHEFMKEGYLPQALKNYIALLGWTHPEEKEILSESELISSFNPEKLHPQGAAFDIAKLRWMNSVHLKNLDDVTIWSLLAPFLEEAKLKLPSDSDWQVRSVQVFRSKMETLLETVEFYKPLSEGGFAWEESANEVLTWPQTRSLWENWRDFLLKFSKEFISDLEFDECQNQWSTQLKIKGKFLFMPLRVAVVGRPQGVELKQLIPLMRKGQLLQRVQWCLEKF